MARRETLGSCLRGAIGLLRIPSHLVLVFNGIKPIDLLRQKMSPWLVVVAHKWELPEVGCWCVIYP